jgi:hypothetical protein
MTTPDQTSLHGSHYYANWAKERIDEIDATLTSLEGKVREVQADAHVKMNRILADLRERRDAFRDTIRKHAKSDEAAWMHAKARLENDWTAFEAEVQKYVESLGKQAEQKQAIFQARSASQLKSWHEMADKFVGDAKNFAADRQHDVDATLKHMKADTAAAQGKLEKLNKAGSESWSALNAALVETRHAFDRANQAAHEAFKRARSA